MKETTFGVSQFINYLESKNHSKGTQELCLKCVKRFFKWAKKEDIQITKPDILAYLEYLKNTQKLGNQSRKLHLQAINHYFTFLCQSEQISVNPCLFLKIRGTKRKTLYKIYTLEQLDTLFDNYYQFFVRGHDYSRTPKNMQEQTRLGRERNAVILSFLIYQKTALGEMEKIELNDIDLIKASVKIKGTRRANDRTLPLNASQIGLIMNYLHNVRPKIAEYQANESEKLFLSLPSGIGKQAQSGTLVDIFSMITEQLRTIDKQFVNFKQIRASTVSFWIKTHGLRKAQYLAGHRYISSTENYLPNNLDELKDDINKLHPF